MEKENQTLMDSTAVKLLKALQRKAAAEYRTINFLRELYESPIVNSETKKLINEFIAASSRERG